MRSVTRDARLEDWLTEFVKQKLGLHRHYEPSITFRYFKASGNFSDRLCVTVFPMYTDITVTLHDVESYAGSLGTVNQFSNLSAGRFAISWNSSRIKHGISASDAPSTASEQLERSNLCFGTPKAARPHTE